MAVGDDLLLTRAEAARRLNVSVQTVRRLAESGHLDEVQVSARSVRVRAASVDRLVREGLPRRRWVRDYQHLVPRTTTRRPY
jgi:excisionase family DNA binding protein